MEETEKNKRSQTFTSSIFVIEVNLFTSWVLDTGYGSHICLNEHDLKRNRALAKGKVDLRVGSGVRVAALAVGSYDLTLPTWLVINLENVYFVLTINKDIILVSCLDKIGFSFIIKDKCCFIYLNKIFMVVHKWIMGFMN